MPSLGSHTKHIPPIYSLHVSTTPSPLSARRRPVIDVTHGTLQRDHKAPSRADSVRVFVYTQALQRLSPVQVFQ